MIDIFIYCQRYLFVVLGIIFVLANNTFAGENIQSKLTPDEIVHEIAPFVDECTVLVCYIDCAAMNELHKFSTVIKRATNLSDDVIGLSVKNVLKQIDDALKSMETKDGKGYFSCLLDNDITHFYIIFNIQYLRVGAFYVIPSVGNNAKKIKAGNDFFIGQNRERNAAWTCTKDDYLIIGGRNSVLTFISTWFSLPDTIEMSSLASCLTDEVCYWADKERIVDEKAKMEHINEVFRKYKQKNLPVLQSAFNELKDSNAIKLVLLANDSTIAKEFLWAKKMREIDSLVSLNFIRASRNYITLSLDTNMPNIKIRIKIDSIENSKTFQQYLTLIICGITNNHFRQVSRRGYNDDKTKKDEWLKFLMYFIPKVRNDTLTTDIDEHFFDKLKSSDIK